MRFCVRVVVSVLKYAPKRPLSLKDRIYSNEATSEERPKNIRVLWIFQKKARKILALRKPVE